MNTERMRQWLENYVAKQQEEDVQIKNMMSNTSYIEWLKQFTKDKDQFSDVDWLYFEEKISESDKKMLMY